MGLLNRLFGYRWSLYLVHDGQLVYAMHQNSVIRILGYVMNYFAKGEPVHPWTLHLNFNHKHQSIQLKRNHFSPDGNNLSRELISEIERIDPGYRVQGGEPVFMYAPTKKVIPISAHGIDLNDLSVEAIQNSLEKMMNQEEEEPSYYSIMDEIFGGTCKEEGV